MKNNGTFERRKAESSIEFYPLGARVVVKGYFKVSPLELIHTSKNKNFMPYKQEVVAFGCDTHSIELGDNVLIRSAGAAFLNFPWNKKSIESIIAAEKTQTGLYTGQAEITAIEYCLVDFYDIMAINTNSEISSTVLD